MASICHLPENILLHILSFLPVKERCIAGRVCRQWRRIVRDNSLWRHVNLLQYRLNVPKMWKLLRAHFSSCLVSIKIGGHAHAASIKRNKTTITNAMLNDLQKRCPNLHILHLDHCNTDDLDIDSLPSSITSLSITHSTWQPQWFKQLEGNQKLLPHLTSLDLSSTTRVDNFDLMVISKISTLTELSLANCYRIKGTGFDKIAKDMMNLISLNLNSTGVDELSIHHIARHCKQLEKFSLSRCANVTDSCLEEIALGLKNLVQLDVSECKSISSAGLRTLSSLRRLKELVIQGIRAWTDDEIAEVTNVFIQEDIHVK